MKPPDDDAIFSTWFNYSPAPSPGEPVVGIRLADLTGKPEEGEEPVENAEQETTKRRPEIATDSQEILYNAEEILQFSQAIDDFHEEFLQKFTATLPQFVFAAEAAITVSYEYYHFLRKEFVDPVNDRAARVLEHQLWQFASQLTQLKTLVMGFRRIRLPRSPGSPPSLVEGANHSEISLLRVLYPTVQYQRRILEFSKPFQDFSVALQEYRLVALQDQPLLNKLLERGHEVNKTARHNYSLVSELILKSVMEYIE